jgi:site-specific DNA recombinase
MRLIKLIIFLDNFGLPFLRDLFFQKSLNAFLCHLTTVSGLTIINARLDELGQEMMGFVRLNARAGTGTSTYETEYLRVSEEMELIRERKAAIAEAELSELMRQKRIEEMKGFFYSIETLLAKFDGVLFRRLVDGVIIHPLVEVVFILRSGIELREVLG